jgi:hypothetical protein
MEPNLFTPKALNEIYRYSKGIPRLINIVCDNALLTGFATDQKVIGDKIIREVIGNLEGLDFKKKRKRHYLYFWIFLGCLGLGIFLVLWKELFLDLKWGLLNGAQILPGLLEKLYQEFWRKISGLFP